MKAIVYQKYGPPEVLQLKEVDRPSPKADEVLIKVHAVSLNRSDWEALRGTPLYAASVGFSGRDATYSGQTYPDELKWSEGGSCDFDQVTRSSETSLCLEVVLQSMSALLRKS
jgi:hypothetical protein